MSVDDPDELVTLAELSAANHGVAGLLVAREAIELSKRLFSDVTAPEMPTIATMPATRHRARALFRDAASAGRLEPHVLVRFLPTSGDSTTARALAVLIHAGLLVADEGGPVPIFELTEPGRELAAVVLLGGTVDLGWASHRGRR